MSAALACAGTAVVPNPTCAEAAYTAAWVDTSAAAATPATTATIAASHNLLRAAAIFAMSVVR